MPDSERIDRLLDTVRDLWKENPDLRLCQIISNAVRLQTGAVDVFNARDRDLAAGLRKLKRASGASA